MSRAKKIVNLALKLNNAKDEIQIESENISEVELEEISKKNGKCFI